jgi:hypothetical protein
LTIRLTASLALCLAACGGGEDSCGPGDVTGSTITASSSPAAFTYEAFESSPNQDCPNPGSPTPITIQGTQTDSGRPLVLCISQPETITAGEVYALSPTGVVRLIDLQAVDGDCNITAGTSGGTAEFTGFCDDGTAAEGFALTMSGTISATKSCSGLPDETIELQLSGSAVVQPVP